MSTFDLQRNALGNGGCSVAEGERTSGGGAASAAANLALWFALFVAPLLLLRSLRSGKKAVRKAGLLLLPAALLFASGAQAGQFFGKTQRLHRTTDGLGAFTIDTDEMIPKGKFVGTFAANYVKRPINKGNVQALTVEEDRVHNLLTVKLEGAYGLTPDFSVGVDLPYNFVQDAKDAGGADITDNDFGDIRVNGEWRIVSKATWGVAFLPVVVSPTGDKDAFLTQRKFSDGGKFAGRLAATGRLTLLASAAFEAASGWTRSSSSPDHFSAWTPFGAAATYAYKEGKSVGEVNVETIADKPFSNRIVTPIEWLVGYKGQAAKNIGFEAGGGRGFNEGICAPRRRGFSGITYSR